MRTQSAASKFELIHRLGYGATGEVYKARGPCGLVAIKRVRNCHTRARRALLNEFESLQGLAHPNVIRHHALFTVGSESWLVMEYLESTLDDWLGDRTRCTPTLGAETSLAKLQVDRTRSALERHGEQAVRDVLGQLARGIIYLHHKGRLHRDLKPANVLIDARGRVVITDFDLATFEHTTLPVVANEGTAGFLAPECMSGGRPSEASDWFSFGVMLHCALTGYRPHYLPEQRPLSLRGTRAAEMLELSDRLLAHHADTRAGACDVGRVLGSSDKAERRAA